MEEVTKRLDNAMGALDLLIEQLKASEKIYQLGNIAGGLEGLESGTRSAMHLFHTETEPWCSLCRP